MKKTSGSGLIFAVVLLFVILGMVVTLSSVTVLETKMNQKTKSSVGAFYNSESGVEWALNQIATKSGDSAISTIPSCPFTGCSVLFLGADGKVITDSSRLISEIKAVRSVGTQGGETQRAIEAAVAASEGWVKEGAVVHLENSSDNVGIGTASPQKKLDVAGPIHIGDELGACPSIAIEGTIAYSAGNRHFWGCTQAGWKQIDN